MEKDNRDKRIRELKAEIKSIAQDTKKAQDEASLHAFGDSPQYSGLAAKAAEVEASNAAAITSIREKIARLERGDEEEEYNSSSNSCSIM